MSGTRRRPGLRNYAAPLGGRSRSTPTGQWDEITLAGRRDLISAVVESATVAPGRGDDRITIEPFSE
jgi:hypothetical protein